MAHFEYPIFRQQTRIDLEQLGGYPGTIDQVDQLVFDGTLANDGARTVRFVLVAQADGDGSAGTVELIDDFISPGQIISVDDWMNPSGYNDLENLITQTATEGQNVFVRIYFLTDGDLAIQTTGINIRLAIFASP